jgi:hypothetical protein
LKIKNNFMETHFGAFIILNKRANTNFMNRRGELNSPGELEC